MRYFVDKELDSHIMLGNGPIDIMNTAISVCDGRVVHFSLTKGYDWFGRTDIDSWQTAERAAKSPWTHGLKLIKEMLAAIHSVELPEPLSRKRVQHWNDEDGEIEVDRALTGEPNYMRRARRALTHGETHINLLLNVSAPGSRNADEMLWRGAAGIAVSDLLEQAGYSVEVWAWKRTWGAYIDGPFNHFIAFKLKESGEPAEINSFVAGVSPWFLRTAMFGAYYVAPNCPIRSLGTPDYEIGQWRKHLDIDNTVIELQMPVVWTEREAIDGAKSILQEIVDHQLSN